MMEWIATGLIIGTLAAMFGIVLRLLFERNPWDGPTDAQIKEMRAATERRLAAQREATRKFFEPTIYD